MDDEKTLLDKLAAVEIRHREPSWVNRLRAILPQIEQRLEEGVRQADIARAFGCTPGAFSAYLCQARRIASGAKPQRTVGRPRKAVADPPPAPGGGPPTPSGLPAMPPAAPQPGPPGNPRPKPKPFPFNFKSDNSHFVEDDDDS